MEKSLYNLKGLNKVLITVLLSSGIVWASTEAIKSKSPVEWDQEASKEVTAALHEMHQAWKSGDIKSLKRFLEGDDVLVTFELDPVTHTPIRLTSRDEIWSFVDRIVADASSTSGTFVLGHPQLNCRATKNLAICTEICSVKMTMPGNMEKHYNLWSTTTAVKYKDGWKWIQWHMSAAGPIETYREGELVSDPNKLDLNIH